MENDLPMSVKRRIEITAYEKGRDELTRSLVEAFRQRATDKAEILANNGISDVPILFEEVEIISIIENFLK